MRILKSILRSSEVSTRKKLSNMKSE